jgi:hypothetical protein
LAGGLESFRNPRKPQLKTMRIRMMGMTVQVTSRMLLWVITGVTSSSDLRRYLITNIRIVIMIPANRMKPATLIKVNRLSTSLATVERCGGSMYSMILFIGSAWIVSFG